VLQGDLIGETEDGYRFTTSRRFTITRRATWKQIQAVKISSAFFSIEGKGLLLDLGKEKLQILSNATT